MPPLRVAVRARDQAGLWTIYNEDDPRAHQPSRPLVRVKVSVSVRLDALCHIMEIETLLPEARRVI